MAPRGHDGDHRADRLGAGRQRPRPPRRRRPRGDQASPGSLAPRHVAATAAVPGYGASIIDVPRARSITPRATGARQRDADPRSRRPWQPRRARPHTPRSAHRPRAGPRPGSARAPPASSAHERIATRTEAPSRHRRFGAHRRVALAAPRRRTGQCGRRPGCANVAAGHQRRIRHQRADDHRRARRDLQCGEQRDGRVVHAVCGERHPGRRRQRCARPGGQSGRISAGPNADGSGGVSEPDSAIPTGRSAPISCSARWVSRASPRGSPSRPRVRARRANGRWRCPMSRSSTSRGRPCRTSALPDPRQTAGTPGRLLSSGRPADNQLLRGPTGVQISDGATVSLGDAADNTELSASVDPGADGPHTVTVYRTAGGGWPTAEESVSINVDRTPPSVPQMVAPPAGAYPVTLTTTPSTDGASGSGVARIEFTDDGGPTRARLRTSSRARAPYRWPARAVDVAGNASAWSAPIGVVVPASGSGTLGRGGLAGRRRGTAPVDGHDRRSRARRRRRNRADAHLGCARPGRRDRRRRARSSAAAGAHVAVADGLGLLARGTTQRGRTRCDGRAGAAIGNDGPEARTAAGRLSASTSDASAHGAGARVSGTRSPAARCRSAHIAS